MELFSLKFRWLQCLLLNEMMDVSSWNVGHVLKTAGKWSSWSLIQEQDGTLNASFIWDIHMSFLSHEISLTILPMLLSPSLAILLKDPNVEMKMTKSSSHKQHCMEEGADGFWLIA